MRGLTEREARAALKEHQRLHEEEVSRLRTLFMQIKKRVLKNMVDSPLRQGILEDCNKGLDSR